MKTFTINFSYLDSELVKASLMDPWQGTLWSVGTKTYLKNIHHKY